MRCDALSSLICDLLYEIRTEIDASVSTHDSVGADGRLIRPRRRARAKSMELAALLPYYFVVSRLLSAWVGGIRSDHGDACSNCAASEKSISSAPQAAAN